MTVPDVVPSLFHNSLPSPPPSLAWKNSVLPTAVMVALTMLPLEPKFFTSVVPDDVPSLFHNSIPGAPSVAQMKNSVPPALVRFVGFELPPE